MWCHVVSCRYFRALLEAAEEWSGAREGQLRASMQEGGQPEEEDVEAIIMACRGPSGTGLGLMGGGEDDMSAVMDVRVCSLYGEVLSGQRPVSPHLPLHRAAAACIQGAWTWSRFCAPMIDRNCQLHNLQCSACRRHA